MAETEIRTDVVPTGWVDVATGAGDATITAYGHGITWAITPDATAPSFEEGGHTIKHLETLSMTLAASERLWLKGEGRVTLTADTVVAA